MKDYYKILGVPKTASDDEVKKAYRKQAMQHHPDRGGDEKTFKEVNEAYEILSNKDKRNLVDQGIDPLNPNQGNFHRQGANPFEFHFHTGSMEDVFRNFGFGGFGNFQQDNRPRNKSLHVELTITLEEAYTGIDKNIQVRYANKTKIVNVDIPAGIDHGSTIRYSGLGDDSIPGIPAGDLTVSVFVQRNPRFAREGPNLLTDVTIDCFDAILGTSVKVTTLDNRVLDVTIPPGTQPGTTLGLKNEGMRDQYGNIGRLYLRISVTVPVNLDSNKINLVKQLKN